MPYGITVTIQRQTEDKFGNWVTSGSHTVGPCGIDYTNSTELTSNQDTVSRVAVLYCPPGANIVSTDRVLLPDGSQWSVVGHTADFANPMTGWNPGLTVRLEAV